MSREPKGGSQGPQAQAPVLLLLQGSPGVGKTLAALSFPRPLVFDFNCRVAQYAGAFPELRFHDDYSRLDKQKPPQGFKQFFEEDLQKADLSKFDTLVLDSFAEMQQSLADWAVYTRLGGAVTDKNRGKLELQDYGWIAQYSDFVVKLLIGTGKHVVVIVHEDLGESDTPNFDGATLKKVLPSTIGKIRNSLAKSFDFYFGMTAETAPKTNKTKHSLITSPQWGRDFKITSLKRELFEPIIDVTGKSVYEEITKRLAQGGLGSQAGGQPSTPITK